MLDLMSNLGKSLKDNKKVTDEEVLVDSAKLENTKKVIYILFRKDGSRYKYSTVGVEDNHGAQRYLYSTGASRGTDLTPSSLIIIDKDNPKNKFEKTLDNKILGWLKKNESWLNDNGYIGLYDEVKSNEDEILKAIENYYNNKEKPLLTIAFEDGVKSKFIGDIVVFKDYLKKEKRKRYYESETYGKSTDKGTCFICGESGEVYGLVMSAIGFSFANIEKLGFFPNFRREDSWKYIPICEKCAMNIEAGKWYMDKHLSFNFYDIHYYVLPNINVDNANQIFELLETYEGKSYDQGLMSEEDSIKDLSKSNVIPNITFIFYKKKHSKYIDLLELIDEVPPSNIKKIYDNELKVYEDPLFGEETCKKLLGRKVEGKFVDNLKNKYKYTKYNWLTRFLYEFLSKRKVLGEQEFLKTMSDIMMLRNPKLKMNNLYMDQMRDSFFKGKNISYLALKSLMVTKFLKNLNMIDTQDTNMSYRPVDEELENFFKEYGVPDYGRPYFSVGVLVGYLLYKQRKDMDYEFGKEPFRSKLYWLRLNPSRLKTIFTNAVQKLSEYGIENEKLVSTVGKYSVQVNSLNKVSVDDVSYYFTLGMVLWWKFA
ncbi:MAG: TM1802 family CRISPR-associated protein [Candidatus Parvarchaeota archaeon]